MGPQFNPCGSGARLAKKALKMTLQWGRSLIPAEAAYGVLRFTGMVSLQWGRSLIPAEADSDVRMMRQIAKLQWGRSLIPAEAQI